MTQIQRRIVLILVAAQVLMALAVTWNRISRNVVIDAAESAHGLMAYEAFQGAPLYSKRITPDIQQVHYGPLPFIIMGHFLRVFGVGIRALRLATFLFAAGAALMAGLIAWTLSRDKLIAWAAGGLMSALPASIWFIEVGPNTFHAFFALLGFYLLIRDRDLRWGTVLGAMAALFAGFWCKQTGMVYLAAGIFCVFVRSPKKGLVALGFAALLVGGGTWYYLSQPDSDFLHMFYLFQWSGIVVIWDLLLTPVLFPENLGRFGVLFAVIAAYLFTARRSWKILLEPEVILLGASAFVGIYARLKYGSGPTQALVFNGMLLAVGLSFLNRLLAEKQVGGTLATCLIALQCLALVQDPRAYFITADDETRSARILDILSQPGKRVYYANQGFWNVLAGKPPVRNVGGPHGEWHNGQLYKNLYPKELSDFFGSDPFDIVIIDIPTEMGSWFLYDRLNAAYQPVQEIPAARQWPILTLRYQKYVFVKKQAQLPAYQPIAP
ncbi:MAG: hypothetical protein V1873_07995 [Verrucomicrobiota bacterium]